MFSWMDQSFPATADLITNKFLSLLDHRISTLFRSSQLCSERTVSNLRTLSEWIPCATVVASVLLDFINYFHSKVVLPIWESSNLIMKSGRDNESAISSTAPLTPTKHEKYNKKFKNINRRGKQCIIGFYSNYWKTDSFQPSTVRCLRTNATLVRFLEGTVDLDNTIESLEKNEVWHF